ncbi:MAG: hypothetical protein CO132_04785 [Candidatus Kerfeldbacteria bacterium CG_4_9_14_3_um_filter_45_8]|nr:MAG: hypothetical protein CO132_04785 [Candidatus Kerfeldbacteria bacterium CG_4_9_14_3_um_filter_45_8]
MFSNRVSVVVVTYDSAVYIPALAASVRKQSVSVSEVVVIDNSPTLKCAEALAEYWPEARVVRPGLNLDWCKGANLGIVEATGEYIFVINPDVTLEPSALERLLEVMEEDKTVGAVAPKLRRLLPGDENILDGMGIVISRSRRFTNQGEGEFDSGQYDSLEPFGFSGAATLFRRTALLDIAKYGGGKEREYYDEDFVAYKDDVDLSYRLRHRGWLLKLVPMAVANHARTAKELKSTEGLRADRKSKSLRIRSYSWRNHLWTIIKNEPLSSLLIASPWIISYELVKLIYILSTEPTTLRAVVGLVKGLPKMLRKRQAILTSSRISATNLRKAITSI